MTKVKKIINVTSWVIIGITILLLVLKWNEIDSVVGTHMNLFGQIDSYGSKTVLISLVVIEMIVNLVLTLGYKLPYESQLNQLKGNSTTISCILQMGVILMITLFIIATILS